MIHLLKTYKGSKVYGTEIETSDIDYFGLFKYDLDTYLSLGYSDQINNSKDDVDMEVRKYLKLLSKGSPIQLEPLFTPEKFILHKNKCLDELFENKNIFITKKLNNKL